VSLSLVHLPLPVRSAGRQLSFIGNGPVAARSWGMGSAEVRPGLFPGWCSRSSGAFPGSVLQEPGSGLGYGVIRGNSNAPKAQGSNALGRRRTMQ
jgi:hypothetical protein